jgi:hypothetical protein
MRLGPGEIAGAEPSSAGVSNGTRTRDIRDHNAALYQLSYTHHEKSRQDRDR